MKSIATRPTLTAMIMTALTPFLIHCGEGGVIEQAFILTPEEDMSTISSDAGGQDMDMDEVKVDASLDMEMTNTDMEQDLGDRDMEGEADMSDMSMSDAPKWTIFVYMISDNNLEKDGVADLAEMFATKASKDLQFIVQIDRATEFYELGVGDLQAFTTAKRLKISGGNVEVLDDLGEVNMSDPKTLEDFLTWGGTTYGASPRKALVVWDHGMAWQGFGDDISDGDAKLTLDGLFDGLNKGVKAGGIENFEFLGFDACLMADLAVARQVKGLSNYMIASEDYEPAHGWNYDAFNLIADNPDVDVPTLGKEIIKTFKEQAREKRKHRSITLSMLDLTKLDDFNTAFDAWTKDLESKASGRDLTEMAKARQFVQDYGRNTVAKDAFHMIDIGHFATLVKGRVPSTATTADALTMALGELVIDEVDGALTRDSTGLAVYFPPKKSLLLGDFSQVGEMQVWQDSLDTYYTASQGQTKPAFDAGNCTNCSLSDDADNAAGTRCDPGGQIVAESKVRMTSLDTASRYFGYVGYRKRDGTPIVLRRTPAILDATTGDCESSWDQRVLVARQGRIQTPIFSKSTPDGVLVHHEIPVEYQSPGSCPCVLPGSPGFADTDGDGISNCIDPDIDDDAIPNDTDNCLYIPNRLQEDLDGNGIGDECDGIPDNAPQTSCNPTEATAFGPSLPGTWIVTTHSLRKTVEGQLLFVRSTGGVSERSPEAGGLIRPKELQLDSGTNEWVWRQGRPLSMRADRKISFDYAPLDQVYERDDEGKVKRERSDQGLVPLTNTLSVDALFVQLRVENADGQGDEVHFVGERNEVASNAGCPVEEISLCPANQITDCNGTCVSDAFLTDSVCQDGVGGGADLYCQAYGYDISGGCEPPPCEEPGAIRDCRGECTATMAMLGDAFCHDFSEDKSVDLNCALFNFDQGDCTPPAGCGNGMCDGTESCGSCPTDCGACPAASCGDGTCQAGRGEDCSNCAADCGACMCGDGVCDIGTETCTNCAADCGACPACGDQVCSKWVDGQSPFDQSQQESCLSCPGDCGACGGSCCETNDAGGCGDPVITQCVCNVDDTCCTNEWSESCVQIAQTQCNLMGCCVPDCTMKDCGSDGCGGLCGSCPQGDACLPTENICGAICGDGFIGTFETCDDGNTTPGDGCDDVCQLEPPGLLCGNTCALFVNQGTPATYCDLATGMCDVVDLTLANASAVAVADLNADGYKDAVFSALGDNTYCLNNGLQGGFTCSTMAAFDPNNSGTDEDVLLEDMNGDSVPDIIIAGGVNRICLSTMPSMGGALPTYSCSTLFTTGAMDRTTDIAVTDIDANGRKEVVLTSGGPTTSNSQLCDDNAMAGTYVCNALITMSNSPEALTTGDFDGDADQDLVIASSDIQLPDTEVCENSGMGLTLTCMGGGFSFFNPANDMATVADTNAVNGLSVIIIGDVSSQPQRCSPDLAMPEVWNCEDLDAAGGIGTGLVLASSVHVADVDFDGDEDLLISVITGASAGQDQNQQCINDGTGVFTCSNIGMDSTATEDVAF